MTEEEYIAMIAAQQMYAAQNQALQYDSTLPYLDVSLNDFGQGHNFLGLEDEPESWKRATEAQNQIEDVLKLSGLYLEDIIPGLPRQVDAPTADPYIDYDAALYTGPAYEAVKAAVAAGRPFDAAVNDVIRDVEFQQFLPKNLDDEVDVTGFRTGAANALSGSMEGQAKNSEYERQLAEYDAYVNGEDQFTSAFGGEENFDQLVRQYMKKLPENPGTNQADYLGEAALGRPTQSAVNREAAAPMATANRGNDQLGGARGVPDSELRAQVPVYGHGGGGDEVAAALSKIAGNSRVPAKGKPEKPWSERAVKGRSGKPQPKGQGPKPKGNWNPPVKPKVSKGADPALFNKSLQKYAQMTKEKASARRGVPLEQVRNQMLLEAARRLRTGGA